MSSSDDALVGLIVVLNIILITALIIASVIFAFLYYKYYWKSTNTDQYRGNLKPVRQAI